MRTHTPRVTSIPNGSYILLRKEEEVQIKNILLNSHHECIFCLKFKSPSTLWSCNHISMPYISVYIMFDAEKKITQHGDSFFLSLQLSLIMLIIM